MSFAAASAVSGGPGTWSAVVPEGWDIFGVTNGGFLMSIATRAIAAEAPGRDLISANGTFLNPVSAGPVAVEVTQLKSGKSVSALQAAMTREGRPLVVVTAALGEPDRPIPDKDLVVGTFPDLPAPAECVPVEPSDNGPLPPPFTGKVEIRAHPADAGGVTGEKPGNALMRGWFRLRESEELDAHAVVLASDALAPAIFNSPYPAGWTPTVDLSVQVRDPSPMGWLACRFATRFVTGGMLEEDGEIWDESGRLVALSRQLALVPR